MALTIDTEEHRTREGTAVGVVILSGSVDASTVGTFDGVLDAMARRGVRSIVLDLERVRHMSSSGFGCIIHAGERGAIGLVKVQDKLRGFFDLLNLGPSARFFVSRAEALAAFGVQPIPPA